MAVELVIKLPDKLLKGMKIENGSLACQRILDAVYEGKILPKGHGRLIDADVFEKRLMDARSYYIGDKADDFDLRFAAGLKSAAKRLVDAPTIIEKNKEQEEPKRDNFDQQAKWLLNGLKIQINALADEKGNQLDLEDVMKIIDANKEQEEWN